MSSIAVFLAWPGRRPANWREQIEPQIDATDRQIDQLVYQLYGLTDEEIAIVEQEIG